MKLKVSIAVAVLVMMTASVPNVSAAAAKGNLALNKLTDKSSDCGCGRIEEAVDGNPETFWKPLEKDIRDDGQVWMKLDLGSIIAIEKAVLVLPPQYVDRVARFEISVSNDGFNWSSVFVKVASDDAPMQESTVAEFASVSARYVKLDLTAASEKSTYLAEFEIYGPQG